MNCQYEAADIKCLPYLGSFLTWCDFDVAIVYSRLFTVYRLFTATLISVCIADYF